MLGTAFPAGRLLLVEQLGGWGLTGVGGSRFDQRIAGRLIRELGSQGVRVLAVRRPGRRPATAVRRWAVADCRAGRASLAWGEFETEADLLGLDPDLLGPDLLGPDLLDPDRAPDSAYPDPDSAYSDSDYSDSDSGLPATRPVYLVCTHGRHDVCCAVEGRPVAAALDRLCPDRVWECSHVGGDRFAANVLVLPTGQLYGRVTDPAALVGATEAGEVLLANLRGQIGVPPVVQAALAHAQRVLAVRRPGRLRPLGVTGEPPLQQVRLATPSGACTVSVERVTGDAARLTCRATADRVPIGYRPVSLVLAD